MSEENKPKVAPLKPPPRVLKAAAGGVENKIAVGAGNGVESNGMKFRPVSESFAKHDVEKGQFMFKLAPRQKDGADTTKTLSSAASAPNLLNDNDGNGQQGDGDSKPAPPRRNPVSPPIEGELRPKGLKSAAGPSPSPTSAVSPPQLKQATFKAKPSPSPSSSTNNSPTSPHPGPANNESPAPAGGAIGGVVLKKAAPRPAPRPSTDESPSPSPAQSPPPPVALPPTTPPPPDVVEESEGSSQFAKARAALAADLTAEKSVSPPVPAAATRVKPAPPKAPDTKEESSENAGNKSSPSIEGAAPAPLKPRALKPAPSPSQDKPGDTPPPQPKPMAKKVVIQAEPNGEEATAKVNFRKSVAPQEGSVAAKAYRMSLPPSELNRIANDPPIPQLKPVAPRVIAPAPASAPAPTSSPAPAPVSAAQEPGDSTSQAPKPVIRKIAIPPGIQDGEPTDTSQKAGFRKSSFPPVQKEEEGGPEHSPPATKAQKAAFRVSSFHPPTNDTDKISPFGHPFKPKPMARKVAPSPPTEQSNTPPPVLDQSNTPAESTSAPAAPVPARPKPFAPKPQPQKTEDASTEAESTQPVQPAAQLRPKFAPRPQQSKPSASPSDNNQPISPPPRAKLPASKPPAGFANLKKVEPSEQADSIQTQEENQIVSQAPDHATSDPIPDTTDSSSTPVSQDVASPTLVSEPPTSDQNVPSPTPAPVVVPRILRPVSVQIASSPEPPRAKQSPKPKPVASPPQSDPTAEPAAPPRPPKPIALSTEQAAVSPPPVSPPPSAETPKSTAPPRPPKHFKKPSDGNLDIEGVATPASVNSAPEPSQDSPPQVTPDRPRKILGSGLVSSGGIKKAPIRPPPPEQPPADLPPADLPPPDLPPPDLPPPPDNIPTEIPPESAAMPIYASSELPVAAEQPPTDIPPPFPARPKRSAPKAPSSRSIVEAPTDLPPPPPPLDVEEPEIVPVADPDPPKAVWVASGHHAADSRPRVRAVTDYEAQAEGQLTFPQGAIMYVVERTNEGYMGCEYNGAIGWVINSFIEEIGVEAVPVHRPSQRATTQLQLGVHHQQPVSPRQTASPPVPAQESPRQAAPKPITKQVSVQRLGSAQPKPAAQPPPPPPAAEDDEDVGSKLDLIAPTGPRLANPKRAGPRKGARPPTRGVQPKIKTKMTTEDAATGPRADLSAVASSGAPSSVGEDGMIAPRRIIAPGNPSMNIAALAVDQKGKLKNTRESVAITPTTQQERAQFKAQFATTAGSYTPPKPVEEEVKEVKEVSKEKDKKSKGLFGILGGGKKKKDKS